ncbi:MAG: type II toxin -antitoxin system TacA 1-like antitoxin [Gaiellaceae bacterium]
MYNQALAKINARWHFRVPAEKDLLVRHAAETEGKTLTEVVVGAVVEAERVLGDRTQFILEPEQSACFVYLFDRSP